MNLTKIERLLLNNQYLILEKLYPEESYKEIIEVLTYGYESHYAKITQHIYDEIMTEKECTEVLNILSMFDCLQRSYQALTDKSIVEEWKVSFKGFDENTEHRQLYYAKFLRTTQNRFTNLIKTDFYFNSHCPTLKRYRNMLLKFKEINKDNFTAMLGKDRLEEIGLVK